MKIVITAEIEEPLTEDEMIFLFDALAQCGCSEIEVEDRNEN